MLHSTISDKTRRGVSSSFCALFKGEQCLALFAIGEALLSHLIAASAAVVIAGVTYTVASKVASKLRNKSYDHYAAVIRKGDVYIGNPISYSAAVARMKSGGDVWSKSYSLAAKVARGAGNGRTPVGPERHGNGKPGYYWHFHTYNRSGGHSFY